MPRVKARSIQLGPLGLDPDIGIFKAAQGFPSHRLGSQIIINSSSTNANFTLNPTCYYGIIKTWYYQNTDSRRHAWNTLLAWNSLQNKKQFHISFNLPMSPLTYGPACRWDRGAQKAECSVQDGKMWGALSSVPRGAEWSHFLSRTQHASSKPLTPDPRDVCSNTEPSDSEAGSGFLPPL